MPLPQQYLPEGGPFVLLSQSFGQLSQSSPGSHTPSLSQPVGWQSGSASLKTPSSGASAFSSSRMSDSPCPVPLPAPWIAYDSIVARFTPSQAALA